MKKILLIIFAIVIVVSCKKNDVTPNTSNISTSTITNANDTLVKFTIYSKRTPYLFEHPKGSYSYQGVTISGFIYDTIKTNSAVIYLPFDKKNFGIGYWVTMELSGIPTDSLSITAEYKGKTTYMVSHKGTSFAEVLLDDIK